MTATGFQQGPVYVFEGHEPVIAPGVFIAPTAAVIGRVVVGERSSIWFSAVVRGDDMPIMIGRRSNIQDGAIIHGTENVAGTVIGDDVVIGHGAILHGCRVESGAMIGIGAIILDGASVGAAAIVAAGSVVPPGKHVPDGTLWVGGAAKRPVGDAERDFLAYAPGHYRKRAMQYAEGGFHHSTIE